MAAKKKAKKAARKKAPAKKTKAAKKKAPAKKSKASAKKKKKTVKTAARKSPAKKQAPAKRKASADKKAPAKKTTRKSAQKQQAGEGNYAASRAFLSDQAGFVERNKDKIPELGKEAEAALEGPEGDSLRDAEAAAAGRSRDTFGA